MTRKNRAGLTMIPMNAHELWLAAGLRTPFARVDGPLARLDAVELSVPVVRAMTGPQAAVKPDLVVWGTVIPNLGYSNIAREVQIEAGLDQTIPAFSTVLACSTSMVAAFEAAGMLGHGGKELALVGGVEGMSRLRIGLSQDFSDWLRRFSQARSIAQRLALFKNLRARDIRLHILAVANRATGKSMGEHCEEMAKTWSIARESQDKIALASHEKAIAGQKSGFFDDLIVPVEGTSRDGFPRADTSLERLAKLQPAFDRKSGNGTITAGNSSPLTDGAAGLWVATGAGLKRLPGSVPRARLVDWEVAAVDIFHEGLLMAPAYAIPRMLARNGLRYADIALWEISGVEFSYGARKLLKGLSLAIPRGKLVAILGASGSGKSTLLRLIGGQAKPDRGTVKVAGQVVHELDTHALYALRRKMGMMFQAGGLFTDMSVFENIAFPMREHTELPESVLRRIVLMKLPAVGLRGTQALAPSELSGGMARRVALARAIAMDPMLAMYDEPFGGLDPISINVIANLIRQLNDSLGATSIVVSYDVSEAVKLVDYVYVIAGGVVAGEGTPEEMLVSKDPYVHQFMHAQPDGPIAFHYPGRPIGEDLGARGPAR